MLETEVTNTGVIMSVVVSLTRSSVGHHWGPKKNLPDRFSVIVLSCFAFLAKERGGRTMAAFAALIRAARVPQIRAPIARFAARVALDLSHR